jgi:hypothetical protein
MKVAVLSMQRVKNYGSVLQAYSLKKLIEEITGEDVAFLDPVYDDYYSAEMPIIDSDDYKNKSDYRINFVTKYIRKIHNHIIDKKFDKEIFKFQKEYLKLDESSREKTYDLVVEGSDEVFKCARRIYKDLYGSNKNGNKLITYAASCGSAEIEGIDEDTVISLKQDMSNFSSMSVRDEHTKEYIKNIYDGPIDMHLDPVLVGGLSKIKHSPVKEKNYIVVYGYANRIRDKEEIESIKQFAHKNKMKTIALGAPQVWCDKYIAVSPFKMLDYFHSASYVVTDTFHGTIFSIINHVKFATIIRKTNRNKLGALLRHLKLEDRILSSCDELENIITKPVNYEIVDEIIEKQRCRTREYLKQQIEVV